MISVPKFVGCLYCKRIFERGKLAKVLTCPYCRRYIKIYLVERFFRRKANSFMDTLLEIKGKERVEIKEFLFQKTVKKIKKFPL